MIPSRKSDIEIAREAVQEGARIIRHYTQNRDQLDVDHKGRHDLVTQADVETEHKIIEVIRRYCPDDEILGEETSSEAGLSNARTWIIDPIDGTTNFAHAFPVFCISIALWEKKEPRVGIVYEVNSDELFSAEKEKGAFLNDRRIQVSSAKKPDEALLGTGFPYRDLELIDSYLRLFKVFMEETHGVRRPGSAAYDLACVAAGRLDGFFEYALSPWDVAAGTLLIREAGGVVTDWEGGNGWLFGKRIVCGNSPITDYLLQRIKEHIPEQLRKAKS